MKKVFTSEDLVFIHHLKNLLQAEGIDSVIKNDRLISVAGEVPGLICWPELWVLDSQKHNWAKEIIANDKKVSNKDDVWICENCGEKHSSQFTECWNCQDIKAF